MQPLRITIPGDYWDCWLYRDLLYLWTMNGEVVTYRWSALIEALKGDSVDGLALDLAFVSGSDFYGVARSKLFADAEIRRILERRIESIARRDLSLSRRALAALQPKRQANPFLSLPLATEIYNRKIFCATDQGLFATNCDRASLKHPISTKPNKLWDCRLQHISARSRRLALAAGDEGLFQCATQPSDDTLEERLPFDVVESAHWRVLRLSPRNCHATSWAFTSILASSHTSESYLIGFGWEKREEDNKTRWSRVFQEIVNHGSIFARRGYGFGGDEKLYCVDDTGHIQAVHFTQSRLGDGEGSHGGGAFEPMGFLPRRAPSSRVVGGAVSYFGTVVEFEKGLVVFQSDGHRLKLAEPVTRWRLYPRSVNFENQLHVVLEDRIEIYAFLHDALVDQQDKLSGMVFDERKFDRLSA